MGEFFASRLVRTKAVNLIWVQTEMQRHTSNFRPRRPPSARHATGARRNQGLGHPGLGVLHPFPPPAVDGVRPPLCRLPYGRSPSPRAVPRSDRRPRRRRGASACVGSSARPSTRRRGSAGRGAVASPSFPTYRAPIYIIVRYYSVRSHYRIPLRSSSYERTRRSVSNHHRPIGLGLGLG